MDRRKAAKAKVEAALRQLIKPDAKYTADQLRDFAVILQPTYIRQVGLESVVDARNRRRRPITESIPDVGAPFNHRLSIEFHWETRWRHDFLGSISFGYSSKGYYFMPQIKKY